MRQEFGKALHKILPVPVVCEDLATLYPPDHDVVQDTWRVKAGLSRHHLTPMLQKSRVSQIQGVKGAVLVAYHKPLTTQEMRRHRLSLVVKNMAGFCTVVEFTLGGFRGTHKTER